MLRACFDASFTMPTGITSIGGFVGFLDDWQFVDDQWSDNLRLWGLDEFHLCDLSYYVGHERADLCALNFGKILAASKLHGIAAGLNDDDWRIAPKDDDYIKACPQPYHTCLEMLFGVLDEHVRLEFKGIPVSIIVDEDVKPREVVQAIFDRYKEASGQFVSLTFSDRRRSPSIQCADLAAGGWRKGWLEEQFGRDSFFLVQAGIIASRSRASFWSKETAARSKELRKKYPDAFSRGQSS